MSTACPLRFTMFFSRLRAGCRLRKKAAANAAIGASLSSAWIQWVEGPLHARGFICNSFTIFFSRLGAGCRLRKKTAADAAIAASRSSAWIWNKFQVSSRSTHQAAT